jgi:nucleotide-binding universal stress UspA family protein
MKKPTRILVALKTTEHAIELTDIACRVGAQRATLVLMHVLELPAATPLNADLPLLDADAALILRTAARVAKRSGMRVTTVEVRARLAGEALIEEMKERKIELAVLGYHHHPRVEEILLGSAARHVVRHAPCQILQRIPPRR